MKKSKKSVAARYAMYAIQPIGWALALLTVVTGALVICYLHVENQLLRVSGLADGE